MTSTSADGTSHGQEPPVPGGGAGTARFPRFDEAYRRRWVDAGLWADTTLHDLFDTTVEEFPDKVALVTSDRRITFRQWKEMSDALAAGLLGAGVGPGQLVSVQLPNWPEMCYLQIALSRIGAVIQPLHTVYREREIRSMLAFCDADAAVVPESFDGFGHADAVRRLRSDVPSLRLLVVARGGAAGVGERSFDDLVADGGRHPERLAAVRVDSDDVFYMNFTSGTEGNPKGFMHTHNTLISLMKAIGRQLRAATPDAVALAMSPMTHSYGHFATYQAVAAGTTMVLVDKYRPADVLALIERERVTALSGTPAHLFGLLHHPDFARYDTTSVRQVGVGGARSAPELLEAIERVWPITVGNTYGLGENLVHTRTTAEDPPEKQRASVGRPVPGTELKIVDPENRARNLPAGEVGEIAFRGPTLCVGYYKLPELTAKTRDGDGWFYTGDLGFVDGDGYLYFAGRGSEVINRGGTKIFPKEIEDLLDGHPGVAEVAVVGTPDPRLGERVCAYVVPEPGANVTLDDLAGFLRQQKVMKHKIPEALVLVDELPMTPTGKVRKVALQDAAAGRAGGQRGR